ncbi:MAG TPA: CHAP domain-containing protein [Gaiellaceae bacterium]|nr:CHAP domain-containing protein [Gaiellaceae bacterium]
MTGDDVREFQELLTRNKYGTFFQDEIDGEFGELTNQGCKRAKFWLGYPDTGRNRWQRGGCGPKLHAYLSEQKPLPKRLAERRRERLRAKRRKPLREKALARGIKGLGTRESPPESNNVRYSRWYMNNPNGWAADGPPWCAMFVTWCYTRSGSEAFDRNAARWAFCPFVVADARQGEHHLTVTTNPKPGDLAVYRFGTAEFKHIGMFEKWIDRSAGRFSAIEGNTSQASDDNGGEVQRRERDVDDGVVFVHVGK